MRVLAIDPGSQCGFAVIGPRGIEVSGVWQLAPGRGESPGARYLRLRARLQEVKEAFPDLRLVAYEQAHQRGGAATEYAVGCSTHIQSWCAEHRIDHASFHSATIKKWATGKGNAGKDELIRIGRLKFSPVTQTSDEVDALWIASLAWDQYGRA